jgi:hypothetical protein
MRDRLEIGAVNSGYRTIKDGSKYDKYFPHPEDQDTVIIENGAVEDTVELMKKVVHRYLDDTKKIAQLLKEKSTLDTSKNIWNFLYNHIQYRLDKRGLEQLRRPARSWADRKDGIDCDCFSIFISSILTNLKIPHSFRITKYGGEHFQHVYVVVPYGKETLIIDPVLSSFDYEKPFSEHKDFTMNLNGIDVAVLSGNNDSLSEVLMGAPDFEYLGESEEKQLDALYNYLVSTRSALRENPQMIAHIEDPKAYLKMLDYAIEYWYTDKRDEALEVLSQNEEKLNLDQGYLSYADDDDDWDDEMELAGKRKRRGFFKKLGKLAKKIGKGIKKGLKEVGKAVVRFNPLTAASRGGFLAALKLNVKKMASKLKWGYATQEQAARNGISTSEWQKSKTALQKIEKLFADKLQGKRKSLRKAILGGKAGGLNGIVEPSASDLSGLGEPISLSASIAAATPVIIAAVKILKDTGLLKKHEDESKESIKKDAEEAANESPELPITLPSNSTPTSSQNSPTVPGENKSPAITTQTTPTGEAKGVMAFVKKNPAVVAIGAGVVLVGGYMLLKPKKKVKKSLSGTTKKRARKSTKGKSTIKKVTLK